MHGSPTLNAIIDKAAIIDSHTNANTVLVADRIKSMDHAYSRIKEAIEADDRANIQADAAILLSNLVALS